MDRNTGQKQPAARATATAASTATAKSKRTASFEAPTLASKVLVVSLIVVSIAVTGTIFAGALDSLTGANNVVKDDQYQAVFLDNGQVYFGKLSGGPGDYIRLQDIYYLQVQQQIQPTDGAQQQQQISLAKLGNELHGPEDEMFINSDRVVFWENLKSDGDVTQAIVRFQNGEQPAATQQQTTQPAATEATVPTGTDATDATDATTERGTTVTP